MSAINMQNLTADEANQMCRCCMKRKLASNTVYSLQCMGPNAEVTKLFELLIGEKVNKINTFSNQTIKPDFNFSFSNHRSFPITFAVLAVHGCWKRTK